MSAIAKKKWTRLLAIGFGLAAGLSLALHLWPVAANGDPEESTPVLIVVHYIARGALLRAVDVRRQLIPRGFVQPGALSEFELLESSGRAKFRSLLPIPEGSQLVQHQLVPIQQPDTLSSLIAENAVAVSFGVDALRGVGGNLQPGDWVDVLSSPRVDESHPSQAATRVLFQALPVLAVGKRWSGAPEKNNAAGDAPEGSEEGPTVLTVAINPMGAVRLAQARENETLSVMLRAPGDDQRWEGLP